MYIIRTTHFIWHVIILVTALARIHDMFEMPNSCYLYTEEVAKTSRSVASELIPSRYPSSPGNRAYCYAELAVSSLSVDETIAISHCAYPLPLHKPQITP